MIETPPPHVALPVYALSIQAPPHRTGATGMEQPSTSLQIASGRQSRPGNRSVVFADGPRQTARRQSVEAKDAAGQQQPAHLWGVASWLNALNPVNWAGEVHKVVNTATAAWCEGRRLSLQSLTAHTIPASFQLRPHHRCCVELRLRLRSHPPPTGRANSSLRRGQEPWTCASGPTPTIRAMTRRSGR